MITVAEYWQVGAGAKGHWLVFYTKRDFMACFVLDLIVSEVDAEGVIHYSDLSVRAAR